MRRSKVQMYFHLVWGTWRRQPLVTPEIEREVYRCIEAEVRKSKCVPVAIGGIPDHVHLAVKTPSNIDISKLMQQVKGVSSTFVRDQLTPGELFRLQEGYAVFSVCPNHIKNVIAYIENQKQHHAEGTLWAEWEETDEEYLPPEDKP